MEADGPPAAAALTRNDLRRAVAEQLAGTGVPVPDDEARWLLEEVSGLEGAELVVAGDDAATNQERAQLSALVQRRLAGEPIQYVLGSWSFRGIDLFLDPRVLIPRPETEIVVEAALADMAERGIRRGSSDRWTAATTTYHVADLGTGSGAIALALAAELPDAEVWATDSDADALTVARANVSGSGAPGGRVRLAQGSWFDALPDRLRGSLRLVVSNPPYVATGEWEALDPSVRDHEPRQALVSGSGGLDDLRTILSGARDWLEPGGTLVLEIGEGQGAAVTTVAGETGFENVEIRPDLTGCDRLVLAHNPA